MRNQLLSRRSLTVGFTTALLAAAAPITTAADEELVATLNWIRTTFEGLHAHYGEARHIYDAVLKVHPTNTGSSIYSVKPLSRDDVKTLIKPSEMLHLFKSDQLIEQTIKREERGDDLASTIRFLLAAYFLNMADLNKFVSEAMPMEDRNNSQEHTEIDLRVWIANYKAHQNRLIYFAMLTTYSQIFHIASGRVTNSDSYFLEGVLNLLMLSMHLHESLIQSIENGTVADSSIEHAVRAYRIVKQVNSDPVFMRVIGKHGAIDHWHPAYRFTETLLKLQISAEDFDRIPFQTGIPGTTVNEFLFSLPSFYDSVYNVPYSVAMSVLQKQ